MFRDDRQVCDAVRVLLGSLRLEHLRTDVGPTEEALKRLDDRGGPLSHGEGSERSIPKKEQGAFL